MFAPSIDHPLHDGSVGVDTAVAQEGPVAAHAFDHARVAFHDQRLIGIAGLGEQAALRVGNEGTAPELEAAAGWTFVAHAVHRGHIDAIGDGVRALYGFPGIVLGAGLGRVRLVEADRRGIEQYLRAAEGRQAGSFGIPLVPADQRSDARIARKSTRLNSSHLVISYAV